jgi:hypothetical protein
MENSDQIPPISAPENVKVFIPNAKEFIYVNASALAMTQFDIRISFAEIMPDQMAETKVGVVMAVEHAALLFFNLLNLLTAFEHHTGPIRLQPWREFFGSALQEAAQAHAPSSVTFTPSPPQPGS